MSNLSGEIKVIPNPKRALSTHFIELKIILMDKCAEVLHLGKSHTGVSLSQSGLGLVS